jgi:hypothetical protein
MPRKEFESFTRLDASDVNTYLMDQSVMTFGGTAARGSAIPTPVEGMVTYLEDSNTFEYWDSSSWGSLVPTAGTASYSFVTTIYYTSSGTFSKADYPWLRAIRVKCVGGGGGGGGCATTGASANSVGSSGGGGGYSESFITDIAGLDSSVTVTRASGGSGGAAGNNNGSVGGNSSFGSLVIASGGGAGGGQGSLTVPWTISGTTGGASNTGDLTFAGSPSLPIAITQASFTVPQPSGGSFLGGGVRGALFTATGENGPNGTNYGVGGVGGCNAQNQGTARTGGAGGNGIVILELYA